MFTMYKNSIQIYTTECFVTTMNKKHADVLATLN
jgi:hypothetical protein